MGRGLCITGGKWLSKGVVRPAGSRMRPTCNINRQRLYNWLGDKVADAVVLDLFAGSGILSWEALSRGASHATLVELDSIALRHLYQCRQMLAADKQSTIISAKLPQRLGRVPKAVYDLVFIDPPFGHNLAIPTCLALVEYGYISDQSLVYLETECRVQITGLEKTGWNMVDQAVSGEVAQHLMQYRGA